VGGGGGWGGEMLSHVSHTNELCDNSQALDKTWSSNVQTTRQFPESILKYLASVVIVRPAYKPCRFALFMWSSCFKSILCMVVWTQHSLIGYSMGRSKENCLWMSPFRKLSRKQLTVMPFNFKNQGQSFLQFTSPVEVPAPAW